jgi:rod shape-determining protein MreD
MIRLLVYSVLAVFALLLQTSLFPALLPSPFKPELLLLLTIYLCLVENYLRGGLIAWSFGGLLDCLGGHYLGLHALIFLLIFFIGRRTAPNLNGESPVMLLFMVACASLLQPMFLFVFGSFADIGRMWPIFLQRSVGQTVVNVLAALVCLQLVAWLQRHYARWLLIPGFGHLRHRHGA